MNYLRLGMQHTHGNTHNPEVSRASREQLSQRGVQMSLGHAPAGQTRRAAVTNSRQLTDRAALGSPLG